MHYLAPVSTTGLGMAGLEPLKERVKAAIAVELRKYEPTLL